MFEEKRPIPLIIGSLPAILERNRPLIERVSASGRASCSTDDDTELLCIHGAILFV